MYYNLNPGKFNCTEIKLEVNRQKYISNWGVVHFIFLSTFLTFYKEIKWPFKRKTKDRCYSL